MCYGSGDDSYYWAVIQEQARQQAAAKAAADKKAADEAAAAQAAAQQAAQQQAAQQQAAQPQAAQQQAAQQQAAATPTPVRPPFDPSPYRGAIDAQFSSLNPGFYSTRFSEALNPQKQAIEQAYASAADQLNSLFAARGLTKSSQKNNTFHELDALKGQELTGAQGRAQTFSDTLQSRADASKNTLYGRIAEGGNNDALAGEAAGEVGKLTSEKFSAPNLSDIFGSVLGKVGATSAKAPTTAKAGGFVNPNKQAYATGAGLNLASGGGSSDVVDPTKKKKKF